MVSSINFHTKEISVKIVYYGPGLCGKTSTLQTIYRNLPENNRPQIVSLATDVDRTIFFDFLPVTAYRIRDFVVRLQLYTVPGQVFYNATRKLVLNGVDGIVFVVDSQRAMQDSNLESLQNLADNLAELGLELGEVPMVMQFNKRDLPDVLSVAEMDKLYNQRQVPVFATVATRGEGLFDALKAISGLVVNDLIRKGLGQQLRAPPAGGEPPTTAPAAPAAADTLARGLAQVTEAASDAPRAGLWPAGELSLLGGRALAAVEQGAWAEVVRRAAEIIELRLRVAAQRGGDPAGLAAFLFLRGTSVERYRSYQRALRRTKAGEPVTQDEALSALIVALEAVW